MLLRSHLREPLARVRQRSSPPSFNTAAQDIVDQVTAGSSEENQLALVPSPQRTAQVPLRTRSGPNQASTNSQRPAGPAVESNELHQVCSEQQKPSTTSAIRTAPSKPAPAPHRTKKPLRSILKRPRSLLFRRKTNTMPPKEKRYYEVVPQPPKVELKKAVRFSLPEKKDTKRPAQSISPPISKAAQRKRSPGNARSDARPSKRVRSEPAKSEPRKPEPKVVAPGLTAIGRKRDAERPKEMAAAKKKALSEVKLTMPDSSKGRLPRREKEVVTCPYGCKAERLCDQGTPSALLGDGYDWVRITKVRRVYGNRR